MGEEKKEEEEIYRKSCLLGECAYASCKNREQTMRLIINMCFITKFSYHFSVHSC